MDQYRTVRQMNEMMGTAEWWVGTVPSNEGYRKRAHVTLQAEDSRARPLLAALL
jgi:hypothetical protein